VAEPGSADLAPEDGYPPLPSPQLGGGEDACAGQVVAGVRVLNKLLRFFLYPRTLHSPFQGVLLSGL
jgi:hypothetical protein